MLHCKDPLCEDRSHTEDRDVVVLDILLAVVESSYTSLPLTGRAGQGVLRDKKVTPGWSAEVEPYRQRSNYSYRAWLAGWKPCSVPLCSEKGKARQQAPSGKGSA